MTLPRLFLHPTAVSSGAIFARLRLAPLVFFSSCFLMTRADFPPMVFYPRPPISFSRGSSTSLRRQNLLSACAAVCSLLKVYYGSPSCRYAVFHPLIFQELPKYILFGLGRVRIRDGWSASPPFEEDPFQHAIGGGFKPSPRFHGIFFR